MAPESSNQEKRKVPGDSWKLDEEQVLPKNKLGIVSFALVCTMFLGILDQVSRTFRSMEQCDSPGNCKTIVATALPTIVAHLHGGNKYSWVARCVLFKSIIAPLG